MPKGGEGKGFCDENKIALVNEQTQKIEMETLDNGKYNF